jgi:D-aminopeptidase
MKALLSLALLSVCACVLNAHADEVDQPQRARDLGVPFEGTPGRLNAITDIPGVEVGQVTLVRGSGPLKVRHGPIRTGVTVVLPRGNDKDIAAPFNAGFFNLNGNGEMTGQSYLQDFGVAFGPIGLTDTNAIGQVYTGIQEWTSKKTGGAIWPVVAETWSGYLNDIEGFHVKSSHAAQAIEQATSGPVAEGNVGGGTGMVCFGFKGGIGTSSRVIVIHSETYMVGVLVQCNTGLRDVLRVGGAPVGQELAKKWLACYQPGVAPPDKTPVCKTDGTGGMTKPDQGSIIIIVGTNAPLSSTQLNRVARRASMGLARLGSFSGNSSGDLVLSFSTAGGTNDPDQADPVTAEQVASGDIDAVFQATVQSTEEAITNALVAAKTMTGADGYTVFGLPHDELATILQKYNRVNQ